MTRASRPLLALSFVTLAAYLGGCSTAEQVRWDPTPEAWTLSRSHDQAHNDSSITVNEDLRQLNQDWKAAWLMDRPSRLSGYPTPR